MLVNVKRCLTYLERVEGVVLLHLHFVFREHTVIAEKQRPTEASQSPERSATMTSCLVLYRGIAACL